MQKANKSRLSGLPLTVLAGLSLTFQSVCVEQAHAQSMLDTGALVAGTTAGTAAGKGVSDGLTKILNKTAKQAEKAAATGKPESAAARPTSEPLLRVGNGVPATEAAKQPASKKAKSAKKVARGAEPVKEVPYNVPDPPPAAPKVVKAYRRAEPSIPLSPVVYSAPPPPPAERVIPSAGALTALPTGTSRAELLSLGAPSSRILMDQGGHVVEVYYYASSGSSGNLLKVRLQDGVISAIEGNP